MIRKTPLQDLRGATNIWRANCQSRSPIRGRGAGSGLRPHTERTGQGRQWAEKLQASMSRHALPVRAFDGTVKIPVACKTLEKPRAPELKRQTEYLTSFRSTRDLHSRKVRRAGL